MAALLLVAERFLPDRGGLAVATSRIARQAKMRGEAVHVVRLGKSAPLGSRGREQRDGLTLHPVGQLAREDESATALSAHLRELLVGEGVDLVHAMYAGRSAYVATLVANELGVPSVVSFRGNDLDRGLFRPSDLPFLAATSSRATRLTAVSRELGRAASRAFGREVEHVTNSVDVESFRPIARDAELSRQLGLPSGDVLGFVGELREKKGVRFLLPAFAEVLRRRPVSLLLIGGVRDDARDALSAFELAAPEAAKRLFVIPYERDPARLSRLLGLCDAVLFPSLWEGTPNALLEAMAAGRPALATAVGGHLELIEHQVTGLLLPLGELARLPDAIEEMLELPVERRAALGARAREFVTRAHDPEQESQSYARIYADARATRMSS